MLIRMKSRHESCDYVLYVCSVYVFVYAPYVCMQHVCVCERERDRERERERVCVCV